MVELHDKLTGEERNYITRLFRYAFEHLAIQELENYPIPKEIEIKSITLDKIPAEWVIPSDPIKDHVILYLHGGGWILGSPLTCRRLNSAIAEATKIRILSIDYRLAPEYPFPIPLEDCADAYKWLLSNGFKNDHIIIAGDSVGGNLTLTTLLKSEFKKSIENKRDIILSILDEGIILYDQSNYLRDSRTKLFKELEEKGVKKRKMYWIWPLKRLGEEIKW